MEHLQIIQQVFTDKLLRVPDYQRGYSWDKKQLDDLIDDIELLEINQEHYTGTLVLHQSNDGYKIIDEEGKSLHTYNIVDGQQRLTTIVILLDLISKQLDKIPERKKLSDGIYKSYIKTNDIEGISRTKLTLNKDCRDYFENNIITNSPSIIGPKIKSHKRLKEAQEYFAEYLLMQKEQFDDTQLYSKWLIELFTKITTSLKLTVYEVPKVADVGIIFEVMNNRGKTLTEMEKVKNYLLYLSSKIKLGAALELGEDINKVWATIFETLMSSSEATDEHENRLLRSHWLMAYDYTPKHWKGNNSIKSKFNLKQYKNNDRGLLDDVRHYIKTLEEACIAYCDIIAPYRTDSFSQLSNEKLKSDIRKQTTKLLRTGAVASFNPILISVRLRHPDNFYLYLKYLQIAEMYSFRVYRFAGRRSNAGQTSLFQYGYEIYNEKYDPEQYIDKITNLLLYYAPEKDFVTKLELGNLNWYYWYGLKYLLYEYEEFLADGTPVRISWNDLVTKKDTIEHILPQTPNDIYWTEKWNDEKIKLYLHDIGNLCITFDNSHYSNKPFPDKKGSSGLGNCYANSSLFMERDLADYVEWTESECQDRRGRITSWIQKRWEVKKPFDVDFVPDMNDSEADEEDILNNVEDEIIG